MKKNYTLILVMLCMFSLKSVAQDSIIGDLNYNLLDKYIRAAKDYYPKRKILLNQQANSKTGITIASLGYLDMFTASYFYRPNGGASASGLGTSGNLYIGNGIQYGINFSLGTFLTRPFLIKKAKSEYKLAQLQTQDYEIALEIEVKKRYYTYIQMVGELKVRTQTAQDNKSVADVLRRRFEKGEVQLDTYNSSRMQLADANTSKIQTEVNYLNAKDALEEIIGAKLSDVK